LALICSALSDFWLRISFKISPIFLKRYHGVGYYVAIAIGVGIAVIVAFSKDSKNNALPSESEVGEDFGVNCHILRTILILMKRVFSKVLDGVEEDLA
jgi:hypothetical protein